MTAGVKGQREFFLNVDLLLTEFCFVRPSANDCHYFIPSFAEFTTSDVEENKRLMRENNIEYPFGTHRRHLGPPSWAAILGSHLGPPSWTAILGSHLGQPSWVAIFGCHLGPPFWAAILGEFAIYLRYDRMSLHRFIYNVLFKDMMCML